MHRDRRRLDHGAVVDDLDRGDHINDIHDVDHARKLDNVGSGSHHNHRGVVDDRTADDRCEPAGDGGSEPACGGGRSPC